MSGNWPISEVAAVLIEFRLVRHTGPDLLRLSSSHFDPERTITTKARAMDRP